MKKKHIKLSLCVLFLLNCSITYSPKMYEYGYDPSDNRISRNLVYLSVSNGGGNPALLSNGNAFLW